MFLAIGERPVADCVGEASLGVNGKTRVRCSLDLPEEVSEDEFALHDPEHVLSDPGMERHSPRRDRRYVRCKIVTNGIDQNSGIREPHFVGCFRRRKARTNRRNFNDLARRGAHEIEKIVFLLGNATSNRCKLHAAQSARGVSVPLHHAHDPPHQRSGDDPPTHSIGVNFGPAVGQMVCAQKSIDIAKARDLGSAPESPRSHT